MIALSAGGRRAATCRLLKPPQEPPVMPTAPSHQGWAAIQAMTSTRVVLLLRQVLVHDDPVGVAACRAWSTRTPAIPCAGEVGHLRAGRPPRCPRSCGTAGTRGPPAPGRSRRPRAARSARRAGSRRRRVSQACGMTSTGGRSLRTRTVMREATLTSDARIRQEGAANTTETALSRSAVDSVGSPSSHEIRSTSRTSKEAP